MADTASQQGFKTTSSVEVTSNAIDRESISYVNFGVYKKNIRGRYQYRKLQFDFKTQTLWNVKGETEKEIRGFKYTDIRAIEKDIENPLSFHIFFRNTPPYHIYAQSRRDAELMCESLDNIIGNNKVNMDTTCNFNIVQIKSGVAMLKNQGLGLGWAKRWVELYKWQMLIKKEDTNTKPMIVKALYHVPIAKDKQESDAPGKGVQYYVAVMFEDEQFVMRFDTSDLRDEWFLAFLNASQEDQELINISKEVGKGKDDLVKLTQRELEVQEKTKGEVADLRAEYSVLDRQTKEMSEEKQKILAEVNEVKASNTSVEAEVTKLSVDVVTFEEKQKSTETTAKSLEEGTAENYKKKETLEQEMIQAKAKIETTKKDIETESAKVVEMQNQLKTLGAQNLESVNKKQGTEAILKEAQAKVDKVVAENTDKTTKLDAAKANLAALEAEVEQILEQAKEHNKQREAHEQATAKLKERQAAYTQQKATLATTLQATQEEVNKAKDSYNEQVKTRDALQKELQDKKETKTAEALLAELDDEDSDKEDAKEVPKEEAKTEPTAEPTSEVKAESAQETKEESTEEEKPKEEEPVKAEVPTEPEATTSEIDLN